MVARIEPREVRNPTAEKNSDPVGKFFKFAPTLVH